MAVDRTRAIPRAVAASADASMSLLVGRARLLGLARAASRGLVFGCGSGHTAAALAYHLGTAVGVDPSDELIACANLIFGSRSNLEFAAGDFSDLARRFGRFDFVYADLTSQRLVERRHTSAAIAALVNALRPAGIAAIRVPARRSKLARRRRAFPWDGVPPSVVDACGRLIWVSGREDGAVWLFFGAPPRKLRLVAPATDPQERGIA